MKEQAQHVSACRTYGFYYQNESFAFINNNNGFLWEINLTVAVFCIMLLYAIYANS